MECIDIESTLHKRSSRPVHYSLACAWFIPLINFSYIRDERWLGDYPLRDRIVEECVEQHNETSNLLCDVIARECERVSLHTMLNVWKYFLRQRKQLLNSSHTLVRFLFLRVWQLFPLCRVTWNSFSFILRARLHRTCVTHANKILTPVPSSSCCCRKKKFLRTLKYFLREKKVFFLAYDKNSRRQVSKLTFIKHFIKLRFNINFSKLSHVLEWRRSSKRKEDEHRSCKVVIVKVTSLKWILWLISRLHNNQDC